MFNQIRVNSSGTSGVRMNMDENNVIRGKNLLFEDIEDKMFLFLEKHLASSGVAGEHERLRMLSTLWLRAVVSRC
jgi:hypothetical protein